MFNSACLLVWGICQWWMGFYVLALLLPFWVMLGPGMDGLYYLVLVLLWSCCNIWLFSSKPSGTIICCSCNLSNSFFNGSCSVYSMHLCGASYSFTPSITYNENVPLKHQIPVKTLPYSSCNSHVIFTGHHVSFFVWTCSKVVYFLFNFVAVLWINLWLFHCFLFVLFAYLSVFHVDQQVWCHNWCSAVIVSHSLAPINAGPFPHNTKKFHITSMTL